MKVKYPKAHTFADVKPGEVFSYTNGCGREKVYLKIEEVADENDCVCEAVNVANGKPEVFADDTPVVILNGSFVVGE